MEAPVEFKDGEKRLICPYNKAHLILYYRMQEHLVKCRRQHQDVEMATCTYNSSHRIPRPELMYHLENCSDRITLDKYLYTSIPEPQPSDFQPTVITTEIEPNGENWDNENQPTYNPQAYCENNMIIRRACIDKMPKSVKRNFRMEQRQKFQACKEELKKPQESTSQPRRPAKASQGIDSKAIAGDEQSELASWMEKVNIGSKVVTTPKLAVPKQEPAASVVPPAQATDHQHANAVLDRHFPALGAGTSMKYSRGRGSRLTQN